MGPSSYKLFLVDLDGTLVGRDGEVSPRVSTAVERLSESLPVSIATGRERADVIRFAGQLGLTGPQISDNGALLLDPASGGAIRSWPMGSGHAKVVSTHLNDLKAPFIATHPGGTVSDLAEVSPDEVNRISAIDLEEDMADRLVAHYDTAPGLEVVKVFYSDTWAVDFTRSGVNKGTAALRLAKLMGIDPGQMIAAGDGYNDLPLLEASGLRIAMGGAPDELMAIADFTAPDADQDGLAVAIEEFVLPMLEA